MLLRKPALGIVVLCIMVCAATVCADYVMMCTYFDNPVARVYRVGDDGAICFYKYLTVGGYPMAVHFASNGKWGLVGGDTTWNHPERQITVMLNVDRNREISVAGSVFNDVGELVAISPDSRWGVHGANLKTIRRYSNGTFTAIPCENPIYTDRHGVFSSLNGRFYCCTAQKIEGLWHYFASEFKIDTDGVMKPTGESISIMPSRGDGIGMSPDGRTLVILSLPGFYFNVFRIHEEGGMSLIQQFNVSPGFPYVMAFTPDSRYAVVTFAGAGDGPDIRTYRVNADSTLSEVGSIILPDNPSEDMDITPDGKFIVCRSLKIGGSYFYVIRLHDDGQLEYLPENNIVQSGMVSSIAFVPPQITDAEPAWSMYE